MNSKAGMEPDWQRIAMGAGAAMFLGMALGRFSYAAMIPALIEAGHLDVITAGYIGGANLVGFLLGAATSVLLAKSLQPHRLLTGVLVISVVSLAASALPWGSLWLGSWRAAIGFATGCIMVLGTAITAQTAPPEHRTTAMSYIFIGVGVGILFGATAVPASLGISITAAWLAVAIAGGVAGIAAAWCWRDLHRLQVSATAPSLADATPRNTMAWYAVIAASMLFSIGIVPHTIYWFEYLANNRGLGYTVAGWHWTGVGIFAIIGPIAAARLAGATNTAVATTITFLVMAIGVGLPWLSAVPLALLASTIIFGAQPAVSTLLGARARDLGEASEMPAMIRAIILANGIGSALAGVMIPMLLDLTKSYEVLFLVGGSALFLGALLSLTALSSINRNAAS